MPSNETGNFPVQIAIAVWSDVVCPWCYIGERRLRQALAARPNVAAELHWRPFQLQPQLPPTGMPWGDFVDSRFGGASNARVMFDRVANVGVRDGITFHFDRVVSAPNTVDAHRILLLAEEQGRLADASEAFFAAYFADGANLNDTETLVQLASRVGLAETDVRELLAGSRFRDTVAESQQEADDLGMQGVPFYVFRTPDGHQWGINGAAETEVFLQTIDTAVHHAREHPPHETIA